MYKRHFVLIISLTAIWISGCGGYDYRKDYQLTTIEEAEGYTAIELNRMGELQLVNGSFTDDCLIVRKIAYESITVYYRLIYQRPSSVPDLNPKRILFVIDGQRYIFSFLGSDRSDIYKRAWVTLEASFLEKIANAHEVKFSVEGSDISIDYKFNKRYLYSFRRFYRECVLPAK